MASSSNKDDVLPSDYDAIVLGTGLAESILAAAFSRIGLKVLHLDRELYYGAQWATFTFNSIEQWIENQQTQANSEHTAAVDLTLNEGETLRPVSQKRSFLNVEEEWYIEEKNEDEVENVSVINTAASEHGIPVKEDGDKAVDPPVNDTVPAQQTNSENAHENNSVETQQADNSAITPEVHPQSVDSDTAESSQNNVESTNKEAAKDTEHSNLDGGNVDKISHDSSSRNGWTRDEVRRQYRRFNLDLCPKVLYCRGGLVNLLISSDIAKYCEFKLVTRILTRREGRLEPVPCSRADVFASQAINMIEKRMLMKFLEFALNYEQRPEEYVEFADRPFIEYLQHRRLTSLVIHYILNAIAMTEPEVPTKQGLACTYRYLMSLGRYGNSSFLWPLYGVSEISQAFCRMCAVFGGVYCLNKTPSHIIVNSDNKCVGMVCDGQRLNCTWAVMETSYAGPEIMSTDGDRLLSRAVLLTDKPLADDKDEDIAVMYLPVSETNRTPVQLLELPPSSYAAPRGMYVVHLTCESYLDKASLDLQPVVDTLFCKQHEDDENKPRLLWSLYYNMTDSSARSRHQPLVDHVEILSGPDGTVHYGLPVEQAKAKFTKICPDEDFLPKAPNPEDIIIEGAEETSAEEVIVGHSSEQPVQPDQAENCQAQASSEVPETQRQSDGVPKTQRQSDGVPETQGQSDDVPETQGQSDGVPETQGLSDGVPETQGQSDDVPETQSQSNGVPETQKQTKST